MQNANDLLMGAGVKSVSFKDKPFGYTVSGSIVREPEVRQQTDYNDGTPKTFANGDPMLQIVVQIQTVERDPADPADDGVRGLYIKGNMLIGVRGAVRASGAKGLSVGGVLSITYISDGEKKGKLDPPKLYTATYTAPTSAANTTLMGAAPAGAPAPATAPTEAPAPPGVAADVWARMATEQRAAVLAAMAQTPPY